MSSPMNLALKIVDPKSPPAPDEKQLRADLRRAIEERESAMKRHAAAADVVEHARAFCDDGFDPHSRQRRLAAPKKDAAQSHGHIEIRRHSASQDVDCLTTSRRFPGEPRFPALALIGMIEAAVERDGGTSISRR
jgi:hypothetical protein